MLIFTQKIFLKNRNINKIKMLDIRKIKTILSLAMALSMYSTIGAFASETIPAHMDPGTAIQ